MAQKLKGIGGVLGGLISPEAATTAQPEEEAKPATTASASEPAESSESEESLPQASPAKPRVDGRARTQARRGRPPGKRAGEGVEKEKVTLRIGKDLMDEYRDWSWEDRCQLGDLVERAMIQYRKHRRQKASNA